MRFSTLFLHAFADKAIGILMMCPYAWISGANLKPNSDIFRNLRITYQQPQGLGLRSYATFRLPCWQNASKSRLTRSACVAVRPCGRPG